MGTVLFLFSVLGEGGGEGEGETAKCTILTFCSIGRKPDCTTPGEQRDAIMKHSLILLYRYRHFSKGNKNSQPANSMMKQNNLAMHTCI